VVCPATLAGRRHPVAALLEKLRFGARDGYIDCGELVLNTNLSTRISHCVFLISASGLESGYVSAR